VGGQTVSVLPGRKSRLWRCGGRTQGFLTVDNVPPWDTWVAYLHEDAQTNYLVSWVPGPLIRMVGEGIRLIPEECAGWVDVRCPHLIDSLAARGIEFAQVSFGPQQS
jgi:hypothetical protein